MNNFTFCFTFLVSPITSFFLTWSIPLSCYLFFSETTFYQNYGLNLNILSLFVLLDLMGKNLTANLFNCHFSHDEKENEIGNANRQYLTG